MKLGILGTGMIAQEFLGFIDQLGFEEVSILGRRKSQEKVERLAQKYDLKVYYDYDEMLASDIDTVYVALPNHLHFEFSKKALEAEKNVILEKPSVTTSEKLAILDDLAKEKKKILIEAVTTHYLPAYRSLKSEIDKVGDVKIVTLNYSQYSSRYDRFKQGMNFPAFDPKQAGGALMDLNVYNLNFVVGIFGAPKEVKYLPNIERDIDTSGIMTLDYGEFKAVCIGAKDCQAPISSCVQGNKGYLSVRIPANQMYAYSLGDNKGNEQERDFNEGRHRMYYEFKEFIRIIEEKDYEMADEMMKISKTVCAILEFGRKQYMEVE